MDILDRELLNTIQTDFPIDPRPYRALGERLCISEAEALARVQALVDSGVIRRIGPSFDSRKLGYVSTLAAMRVPSERLEEVAGLISSYPQVTHNYGRDHAYNLWFTLVCPSRKEIDRIAGEIRERSGIDDLHLLPAERMFKIRVEFDFSVDPAGDSDQHSGRAPVPTTDAARQARRFDPSDWLQRRIVRAIQGGLPVTEAPYRPIADDIGITVSDLLSQLRAWEADGTIRRFGAILRHHQAGYSVNAMCAWNVPDDRVEEFGRTAAEMRTVSHCYQRPRFEGFPYNLYTMIHGRSREECEETARAISGRTGITANQLLYTTAEFKKSSPVYFP